MECPLCLLEQDFSLYYQDKKRSYFQCPRCSLIFVPPENHVTDIAEKERYLEHNNSDDNQGYIDFLSRIISPVTQRISLTSLGLDFGSGPNPVLASLFKKRGYQIEIYDPYFASDPLIKEKKYDFICTTEVVEHFTYPQKEFKMLDKMLNPGGILAVMTRIVPPKNEFGNWFYITDLTHIVFYSESTLQWIAHQYRFELIKVDRDIFIFEKS